MKSGTARFFQLRCPTVQIDRLRQKAVLEIDGIGDDQSSALVTEWLCRDSRVEGFAQMKNISQEEPVARGRFIDCPSCKTHTLKLKRLVQVGRCKSCHESYKIVIVYVKEGKKPKSETKTAPASTAPNSDATLPSWQVPSDSSLFGSPSTETDSIFSDTSSIFGEGDPNKGTSTGSQQ